MPYIAAITNDVNFEDAARQLVPGAHLVLFSNDPRVSAKARKLGFGLRDTMLVYTGGQVEMVYLLRGFLGSTVAENVLAHKAGGLNIEACRVSWGNEKPTQEEWNRLGAGGTGVSTTAFLQHTAIRKYYAEGLIPVPTGRWPTNIVVVHQPECEHLDDLLWRCAPACCIPPMDEQSLGDSSDVRCSRFFPQFPRRADFYSWLEKLITPAGAEALWCM